MTLFALLAGSVFCMSRNDWTLAHIALVPAFLWHTLGTFVLTDTLSGNFGYYLFFFSIVLMFFPHKYYFLKLMVVWLYFLSTLAKLHETWVLGTYFSALKTGLPFFPKWSIPFWTNTVIFMEMVGAWFLLSNTRILQRGALLFFVFFHLYSGLLVEYRYPATVLPTILILFGTMYWHEVPPVDKKSLLGWFLCLLMLVAQCIPILIPGDEKLTLEGNKYGLYMFEANHQCISRYTVHTSDGSAIPYVKENASARNRCDPYQYWFQLQSICTRNDSAVTRISWTFDHSINGNPFLRIVDTDNACALTYTAFKHNTWIKTPERGAEIIGYPVQNLYF